MPRAARRNSDNVFFGVSPWQDKDDYDEVHASADLREEDTNDGGDVKESVNPLQQSVLRYAPAAVTETPTAGAECVLFVYSSGSIAGFFEGTNASYLRKITGTHLAAIKADGYREYLDCTRDASWDLLLLCLHDTTNSNPVYVLAETCGGDWMTITAPADLTSEESSAVASCVGRVTLAYGFDLRFECRNLVNAEIEDKGLVRRQVAEASLLGTRLADVLHRGRRDLSHIVCGRLLLGNF